MPKSSVPANSTGVVDIVDLQTTGGGAYSLGQLANPSAAPTLTAQTTGGSINTTTYPTVYVAFSYGTTPGANGNANGETLISPVASVPMGSSLTVASVLCQTPTTWPAAGWINIYVGGSSTSLYLMTGSGYPLTAGNTIQINSVPTSGTPIPTSNTSWPHGFTASVVHDNDASATSLAPYTFASNVSSAATIGINPLGNGQHQVAEPDSAWSKAGAATATFTISGPAGMAARTWTTAIGSSGGPVQVGGYAAGQDPATLMAAAGYTGTRAAKLDNLDAAVSSRSTYAGGPVASVTGAVGSVTSPVTAGTVTDKSGYALSSAEHAQVQADAAAALAAALIPLAGGTVSGTPTSTQVVVSNMPAGIASGAFLGYGLRCSSGSAPYQNTGACTSHAVSGTTHTFGWSSAQSPVFASGDVVTVHPLKG